MGPRESTPPLPDLEPHMRDDMRLSVRVTQQECNWLQVLEGDIDTVHAGFLHGGSYRLEDMLRDTFRYYMTRDRTAKFEVIDTECGSLYGAYRDGPPGQNYWRLAYFLFPFYDMPAPGLLGHKISCICCVPMDDEHTMSFFMNAHVQSATLGVDRYGGNPTLPNTTAWFGRFRTKAGSTTTSFRTARSSGETKVTLGTRVSQAERQCRTRPSPGAWVRSTIELENVWERPMS
jgi:hypothetical protein